MNLQKIIIIIFIFSIKTTYSQGVEMHINSINIGSNYINECDTIDFESNDNLTLSFGVALEKDTNHTANNATLTIFTKRDNNTFEEVQQAVTFTSSSWNGNTIDHNFNITLQASVFEISGGVLYAQFDEDGYGSIKTCNFPIIKDEIPTFEINPTNTVVACSSTSSKNFNVTNVYNSPGTIQYNWSVGSGWKRNGVIVSNFTTSSSNITLVPYLYPPSNVSVTPVLDGVSYPQQTSIVSLSGFNPNNTVVGPSSICATGNYNLLGNVPSNWSVIWSLQNTTIASLSQTGNSATVTVNTGASGHVTVKAIVINSCGQSKAFTKQVFVGSPVVNNHQIYGGYDNMPVDSHSQLHVDWAQGNTGYLWTITTLNSSGSGTTPKFSATNSNTATGRYVTVNWGSRLGMYVVNCKAINSCSQTGIGHKVVTVFNQSNNPCPPYNPSNKGENIVKNQEEMEFSIKVYPNPVKGAVIYVNKLAPFFLNPCNNYSGKVSPIKEIKNTVAIYDFFGTMVFTKIFDTETFKIENRNLKKGTYFLRVTDSYGITKKTTLKVN